MSGRSNERSLPEGKGTWPLWALEVWQAVSLRGDYR